MSDAVSHHLDHLDPPEMHASRLVPVAWVVCAIGAAALAGLALMDGGASRAWAAVLSGMMLPLWLAVGSIFFISAHAICGAKWTVPLVRVMEGVGAGLPIAIIAFLALGSIGLPYVYEWANDDARAVIFRDPHGTKAAWMTELRWLVTGSAILAIWLTVQRMLSVRAVVADEASQSRQVRGGIIGLILLIPTVTLFMWDALLSLNVQFTSAVFGGYCLVSSIHAFLGALALALFWLGRRGLAPVVRPHLLKDVGTWLVAWSCIVAYISYVQYVIISFQNNDEETFWYLMRAQHGYGTEYFIGIALRCVVPFIFLMSQSLRSKPAALAVAGASVLIGTWIELHWLVVPAFSPNAFRSPVGLDMLVALGFLAASLLLAIRLWRRRGLVPHGDVRLLPAINAEHLQ